MNIKIIILICFIFLQVIYVEVYQFVINIFYVEEGKYFLNFLIYFVVCCYYCFFKIYFQIVNFVIYYELWFCDVMVQNEILDIDLFFKKLKSYFSL